MCHHLCVLTCTKYVPLNRLATSTPHVRVGILQVYRACLHLHDCISSYSDILGTINWLPPSDFGGMFVDKDNTNFMSFPTMVAICWEACILRSTYPCGFFGKAFVFVNSLGSPTLLLSTVPIAKLLASQNETTNVKKFSTIITCR